MHKRLKILYTIPNFDTAGSGKVVYDLVKGLDKTQFEPEICCFHNRGTFFKNVQSLGVKIHIFDFAISYRPFFSLPFRILKIARFFKKHQFDVIHSWHWSSDITEPLAARLVGIPFVYTKKAMGWGNRAWTWRTRLSTKVIAVNTDMGKTFLQPFNDKIVYMPLGVDTNYFKPQQSDNGLMKSLSIKSDDFVIVSVANLVPVKGVELLLEAVKVLDNAKIKILIVGRDNTEYAKSLKLKYKNKNVLFLGHQIDVRPFLSFCSVMIMPTTDIGEGLPIAPLEAMASGCIVLGSDVAGIRDVLRPFKSCLFQVNNVFDLIKKIKLIKNMSNKELENLTIDMGLFVKDKFDLIQCLKNHEQLYKTILKCV